MTVQPQLQVHILAMPVSLGPFYLCESTVVPVAYGRGVPARYISFRRALLAMEKGELLFEGAERTSSVNLREFSTQGARLDVTLAGKVSGKISGLKMTTHNALMKPNGTVEADVRGLIFSNGEPIFVLGKATGKGVDPTPILRIEENLTFQTPSQRLAWLNTTKSWSEGLDNFGTGEFNYKVYAVK